MDRFFPRDEYYMRLALREAERALEHDDVPIGAVVVREGEVLAAACNERELRNDPTAHAEVLVLREAGPEARRLADRGFGALRHDRAVRDVRGRDRLGARAARRVRSAGPEGGRRRKRADVLGEPRLNWQPEVAGGLLAEECAALLSSFFGSRR